MVDFPRPLKAFKNGRKTPRLMRQALHDAGYSDIEVRDKQIGKDGAWFDVTADGEEFRVIVDTEAQEVRRA